MPALCSAFTMSRNSLICEPNEARHAVAGLRREKTERAVSPVVPNRLAVHRAQNFRFVEVANRQQLDGCYAQLLQIRNLFDDAGECAGMLHP